MVQPTTMSIDSRKLAPEAHANNNSLFAYVLGLADDAARTRNWKRWGPYVSERQWGTVREDYSTGGSCWGWG